MKALFRQSRDSLGSREMMKKLREEGFRIGRYVVGRFFGSLKHDWIFKIAQPTREQMRNDVAAYMRYYNLVRLHSTNGDQSRINYEKSLKKVSGLSWPVQLIVDTLDITDYIDY